MQKSVRRALEVYEQLHAAGVSRSGSDEAGGAWEQALRVLKAQWQLTMGLAKAAGTALTGEGPPSETKPETSPGAMTSPLV